MLFGMIQDGMPADALAALAQALDQAHRSATAFVGCIAGSPRSVTDDPKPSDQMPEEAPSEQVPDDVPGADEGAARESGSGHARREAGKESDDDAHPRQHG